MDTSRLKIWWLIVLVPLLMGCPFEEEKCFNDWERITTMDDLIILNPLKDTFQLGDEIKFLLTVPNTVSIGDSSINLYQETRDANPWLILNSRELFENEFDIILGNKGSKKNWYYLEYSSELDSYLLEIHITLTKSGEYFIGTTDRIVFGEQKDCNWYEVRTNIKGSDHRGILEFLVLP